MNIAIEGYQSLGLKLQEAMALSGLASLYLQIGSLEEAEQKVKESSMVSFCLIFHENYFGLF